MSLTVPEPSAYSPDTVEGLTAAAVEFFTTADDLAAVQEALARMAALEEYVAKRDPSKLAELQRGTRRGEARIGELLGPSRGAGRGVRENSPHADNFHPGRRQEFRRLAAHLDVWWPHQAGQSRRGLLKYLDRVARQTDDRAARLIISDPEEPEDTDTETPTPRQPRKAEGPGWTLYQGDSAEVLSLIPDGSVDLIITDPPYPAESLPLWGLLAEEAQRVLTGQGILCALTGQIMLPDVLDQVRLHSALHFGWVYCQPLPGSNSRILARHIGQTWKPWVAFSNGPWPSGRIDWHPDTLDGAPLQKGHYQWQQTTGPAAQLIGSLGFQGAVVLDPFTGSGSYGVAALQMGARFVGIEADAGRFTTAATRLTDWAKP